MLKKLFLTLTAVSILHASDSLKDQIGGEGIPLPPIFNSEDKSLADASKDILPSKNTIKSFTAKFKDGDIVFIRSTSAQSKALEEVTGSHWTHVGVLFRVKESKGSVALDKKGKWMVYEAGPKVRFTPVETFVGTRAFAVQRLKSELNEKQTKDLFKAALTRVGKPYDIYFLLSNDGVTKDNPDYCSELVWYVFAKIGIVLGYQSKNDPSRLSGPEAKKIIKDRFNRKSVPMPYEKWIEQYVISPESQFVSPLLSRIDE